MPYIQTHLVKNQANKLLPLGRNYFQMSLWRGLFFRIIGLLELPPTIHFHFWISIIFDFRYKEDLDEDTGNWGSHPKLEGPSHGAMEPWMN